MRRISNIRRCQIFIKGAGKKIFIFFGFDKKYWKNSKHSERFFFYLHSIDYCALTAGFRKRNALLNSLILVNEVKLKVQREYCEYSPEIWNHLDFLGAKLRIQNFVLEFLAAHEKSDGKISNRDGNPSSSRYLIAYSTKLSLSIIPQKICNYFWKKFFNCSFKSK